MPRMLIINPGSTSTKIGLFQDLDEVATFGISHDPETLSKYPSILAQYDFRREEIIKILTNNQITLESIDAFVGRGGLLKPISSGTYQVDEVMVEDLKKGLQGEHASNLGGILALEFGRTYGKPAFIADPVVVDELSPVARISGLKEIQRKSIFHALNHKAVGKRYAKENNLSYNNLNLIVAHLGGGISVGAHAKGKVIDVNNALNGEGPFSPERAGTLPTGDLVGLCFSGDYSEQALRRMMTGHGGFVSYLKISDARKVEQRIQEGDDYAKLIFTAMAYQVAKEIGAMSTVLKGRVDAIILTGGMAYSEKMVSLIKDRVEFLAKVAVYPGEDELLALAEAAFRVLSGEEKALLYR